ncbi:unnamed protein product [Adineta steineri]|uniref:Uncharacterized protein n=1 Tax=Adineta steineri TaxID=433720 RepID=A0A814MDN7_9BILA|nr:unnamed protein product [Adineta steineri]
MNRSLFWCKTNVWLTYSGGCFSFMCNCFADFCQVLILLPNTEWQRLITRMRAKLIITFTAIIYLLIFIPIPIYNTNFQPSSGAYVSVLTLLLFTLIWYNFQQFLRRRHCIEGVVTRMMLIQMSSILISGIPADIFVCYIMVTQSMLKTRVRVSYEFLILVILTLFTFLTNAEEIVAPISKNEMYLNYVKQAIARILMGTLRVVATQQKLTPNESLAVFFHSSNADSLNLMNDLLRRYIQTCYDEFCWIYDDVYINTTIPLKEALDLSGDHYIFTLLTLLLFTLIWYNFQQFLRRRHCIEGVVTRMMLIQMSSILISGVPAAEEIVAPISKNEIYLDYVKQATVGILMGGLRVVATQQKLTPNESLAVFFHPSNTDSLNLINDLLRKYIQTCCDEFCWIYDDVYINTTIPLKEALDLNGAHYIFSHFNKIFRNSRSNLTPGSKHLNCLAICTAINYMPLLFSTIFTQYKEHCLVGTRSSHDGNWSEAEKNVVRVILQELVQKSIDWLNTNKQEELKKMPFVCQEDDSCNQNWDLFNFSQNKQVIAVANIKTVREPHKWWHHRWVKITGISIIVLIVFAVILALVLNFVVFTPKKSETSSTIATTSSPPLATTISTPSSLSTTTPLVTSTTTQHAGKVQSNVF